MKAYSIQVRDDPDQGQVIVWAVNSRESKKHYNSTDLYFESYIDVQVLRASSFDDMENLSKADFALAQWHEGWSWFDYNDVPNVDENTDEEFKAWYKENFS